MMNIDKILENYPELDSSRKAELKEELLGLFSVSKHAWMIGNSVNIERCIYGHDFKIGQKVEIIDNEPGQAASWLCTDGKHTWWIGEEEGHVC